MFHYDDRVKYTLTDKLKIEDRTQSIITWINSNPYALQQHLNKNRDITLNLHGQVTLKKKLNEEESGSNTKRSPRKSSK